MLAPGPHQQNPALIRQDQANGIDNVTAIQTYCLSIYISIPVAEPATAADDDECSQTCITTYKVTLFKWSNVRDWMMTGILSCNSFTQELQHGVTERFQANNLHLDYHTHRRYTIAQWHTIRQIQHVTSTSNSKTGLERCTIYPFYFCNNFVDDKPILIFLAKM